MSPVGRHGRTASAAKGAVVKGAEREKSLRFRRILAAAVRKRDVLRKKPESTP